jgi:nucleoside-diphosphate-sugar epimerase
MKVFVTGGSGYLGQPVIRALRQQGHEVAALARSEAAAAAVSRLGAAAVRGGLGDLGTLRDAAAAADGVIHLAQDRGPRVAETDQAAAQAMQDGVGAGPYVHTSGAWVYGDTGGTVDESAPFAPPPVVAWRLANEERVLARAGAGGHPVIVMPGLVYGYGAGLIEQSFTAPARSRGTVRFIGDGTSHWALVHVDDIAGLYARALAAPAGAVYVGVGEPALTVGQIAGALSQAAGCPGRTESITLDEARREMGPIADAFALDQQLSSARARAELGWPLPRRDVLAELAAVAPAGS